MKSDVADLLRGSSLIAEVMKSDVADLLRCSSLIAEVMKSDVADLLRCSLLIAEVMKSDVADLLRCSLLIAEVVENNAVVLLGSLVFGFRVVVEVVLKSVTADPLGCSCLNTRSASGEERRAKGEACDRVE